MSFIKCLFVRRRVAILEVPRVDLELEFREIGGRIMEPTSQWTLDKNKRVDFL